MRTVTRTDPGALEVRTQVKEYGQPYHFLITSDVHFDNPKCKRNLYFKHLKEAQEKKAGVFCFGDFFCLMQGKKDRRYTKNAVRPEHNTEHYFDSVIGDSSDLLADYKDVLISFSDGNHETAIVSNVEINPLARLTDTLNFKHNARVEHMPYSGFIRFVFNSNTGGAVRNVLLFYHHGKWGGIVSKGSQSVARYSSIAPQADIIVSGHTHDQWLIPDVSYDINKLGKVKTRTTYHVKTPTYKEEFAAGSGWAVEKIVKPKPLGGWWLELTPWREGVKINFKMAQ